MFVNVGGFGHSGNTALLDFLIDSNNFLPLAKDFGETALIRGRWGFSGMYESLIKDENNIPSRFYRDAFLGVRRDEHLSFAPPTPNDFARNKRVHNSLGDKYESLVNELIDNFETCRKEHQSSCKFKKEINKFFASLELIVLESYHMSQDKHILLRNDPAAYACSLLNLAPQNINIFISREPLDVCYEWCNFYHGVVDEDSVNKFIKQFNNKLKKFRTEISWVPKHSSIHLTTFEDFVSKSEIRDSIYKLLGVEGSVSEGRFIAEKSRSNVGVGSKLLPKDFKEKVIASCSKRYQDFLIDFECLFVK